MPERCPIRKVASIASLLFALAAPAVADPVPAPPEPVLTPPAAGTVDFARDVQPLLQAKCVQCHGRGKAKGGFGLETRAALLQGGDSGPAVVPGDSAGSRLITLVTTTDPDSVMPQKGTRLKPEQVGLLRAWIDQGAMWPDSITFAKGPPRNLARRQPDLPPGENPAHPLDRLLGPYLRAHGVSEGAVVDDRQFARRVHLDVLGLLPSPAELERFDQDPAPDKRRALVRTLLANRRDYATHWLSFWNDLLRNDYKGTGYIDEGRRQITGWLYRALLENRPLDRMVRELVAPTAETEGFVRGIVWRGVVNASQTPEMQAAQNVSQVFLGVNLKCASCHDSFVSDWTLADAYGLASIFAEHPLEMVRCDKPTGLVADPRFLYPGFGQIDPAAPKADRMRQLAEALTSPDNGRVSRTTVNRLWARLLGRGLVEPVDDMESAAWNPDLLDLLGEDLAANGYDLKRTLEIILTSRAYQMAAVPATENVAGTFVFRGPGVRRLTAEQFLDALACVSGAWAVLPAAEAEFWDVPPPAADPAVTREPRWIWRLATATTSAPPETLYLRRTLSLPTAPKQAAAVIACDNRFRLRVNGREVASGDDYHKPKLVDLAAALRAGDNVLAIEAVNAPGATAAPGADPGNPAGLLFYARVRGGAPGTPPADGQNWDVASDASWLCSTNAFEHWDEPGFHAENWTPAVELGGVDATPWAAGPRFRGSMTATTFYGRARAAVCNNDPLLTALGRPNREQVTTTRPSVATTLQGLEFSNGKTLAAWMQHGANRLMTEAIAKPTGRPAGPTAGTAVAPVGDSGASSTPSALSPTRDAAPAETAWLVDTIYARALGRGPSPAEHAVAAALAGSPPTREGVEDLLWAITMLPEFQLIR